MDRAQEPPDGAAPHLAIARALGEKVEQNRRIVAALKELKDGLGTLQRASAILDGLESAR